MVHVQLKVPYYSQHLDVTQEEWKTRACGIACIKMTTEYFRESIPSLDTLIEDGVARGGFGPSGWIHRILSDIARDLGVVPEMKEYKSTDQQEALKLRDEGIKEIFDRLRMEQPVIVSAVKRFEEKDKFHMVVLMGYKMDENELLGFYYHDPDAILKDEGAMLFVPLDKFKEYWRKMAILVNN